MSMLEGFSAFNFDEGVPYVSVTKNGVTFNKAVVMKLNFPRKVVLLINEDEKKIAVQCCGDTTPNGTAFYRDNDNSKIQSVRWNAKDLLHTLQMMMGWDLEHEAYRISGILLKEEGAMLFDLTTAKILN